MARMLSATTRGLLTVAVLAATFSARQALAQPTAEPAVSASIIENPFLADGLAADRQPVRRGPPGRGPIAYQNPFAGISALPPVEITPLPGPASRWRRSARPLTELATVKAAILAADRPDDVRSPAVDEAAVAAAHHSELALPADLLESSALTLGNSAQPPPLAQPAWLAAANSLEGADHDAIRPANLEWPVAGDLPDTPDAWGGSGLSVLSDEPNLFPLVISDYADTPEARLARAQQLAQAATSLDELTQVALVCRRGLAGSPPEPLVASLRRLAAWAHNRRGELLIDDHRHDEAIHDFETAIELDPNCSMAIHNRAVTLAQQNELTAALRDFNRVIQINPGLAIAYRNRAELLAALGRMSEAVDDYSRALHAAPDDAGLHAARGFSRGRMGDFENALADLDRAIELDPNDAGWLTQRGNLLAERTDYQAALADFEQALRVDPHFAEAHRSLAWLQATCPDEPLRDAERALAAARRAAELSPRADYFVLDTLAAAYANNGQFEPAIRMQSQAIAAAPAEYLGPLRQRLALYQQGRVFRSAP